MLALAMAHPKLQGLRRWLLVTRDASGRIAATRPSDRSSGLRVSLR
jgi:hypothetical protein